MSDYIELTCYKYYITIHSEALTKVGVFFICGKEEARW
jgi:hypothetical protein